MSKNQEQLINEGLEVIAQIARAQVGSGSMESALRSAKHYIDKQPVDFALTARDMGMMWVQKPKVAKDLKAWSSQKKTGKGPGRYSNR